MYLIDAKSEHYKERPGSEFTQVHKDILDQLGGKMFIALTGAEGYRMERGLLIKFKGSTKANYVRITVNGADLYIVEFFRVRGTSVKLISEFNDMYCDQLQDLFEEQTGLYTHF